MNSNAMQEDLLKTIKAVKGGDKNAFRRLIHLYQHKAFRLAFRMLGDEEEAQDVVQDSFIRIWEKIQSYDEQEKFASWMYAIVSNRAIDSIRSKKRRPVDTNEQHHYALFIDREITNDQRIENKELAGMIRLLTETLPEKQRLVFSLRDLQGLEPEEVCEITGLTETQVKSNLHHARKAIREKLSRIINYGNREQ